MQSSAVRGSPELWCRSSAPRCDKARLIRGTQLRKEKVRNANETSIIGCRQPPEIRTHCHDRQLGSSNFKKEYWDGKLKSTELVQKQRRRGGCQI
jgi:hypothetical protein